MKRVGVTTTVRAEPMRVWDLYADVEGSVEWVPFMEQVVYISGPAGLGQVYRERTSLGGVSGISEWRVVEWDPPRRQVQLSRDFGMESRLVIELEPYGDGTRLRQSAEISSRLPGPLGWLHERLAATVAGRGIRAAVTAARRRLEAV